MSFRKKKYIVIKRVISKDLALFIYNYFLIKKQVARTLFDSQYISPFEKMFGVWTDKQAPNTYSNYADIVAETLLLKSQPIMEKTTKLKLNPAYSYTRVYKKGDILHRHKDRFSCEISTTMHIGGDPWELYINPDPKAGGVYGPKFGIHGVQEYTPTKDKGVKVNLKPGDMLVYRGCELEHWREPFQGENCVQVFLHYNNIKTPDAEKNIFDGRLHIGLPTDFKRKVTGV